MDPLSSVGATGIQADTPPVGRTRTASFQAYPGPPKRVLRLFREAGPITAIRGACSLLYARLTAKRRVHSMREWPTTAAKFQTRPAQQNAGDPAAGSKVMEALWKEVTAGCATAVRLDVFRMVAKRYCRDTDTAQLAALRRSLAVHDGNAAGLSASADEQADRARDMLLSMLDKELVRRRMVPPLQDLMHALETGGDAQAFDRACGRLAVGQRLAGDDPATRISLLKMAIGQLNGAQLRALHRFTLSELRGDRPLDRTAAAGRRPDDVSAAGVPADRRKESALPRYRSPELRERRALLMRDLQYALHSVIGDRLDYFARATSELIACRYRWSCENRHRRDCEGHEIYRLATQSLKKNLDTLRYADFSDDYATDRLFRDMMYRALSKTDPKALTYLLQGLTPDMLIELKHMADKGLVTPAGDVIGMVRAECAQRVAGHREIFDNHLRVLNECVAPDRPIDRAVDGESVSLPAGLEESGSGFGSESLKARSSSEPTIPLESKTPSEPTISFEWKPPLESKRWVAIRELRNLTVSLRLWEEACAKYETPLPEDIPGKLRSLVPRLGPLLRSPTNPDGPLDDASIATLCDSEVRMLRECEVYWESYGLRLDPTALKKEALARSRPYVEKARLHVRALIQALADKDVDFNRNAGSGWGAASVSASASGSGSGSSAAADAGVVAGADASSGADTGLDNDAVAGLILRTPAQKEAAISRVVRSLYACSHALQLAGEARNSFVEFGPEDLNELVDITVDQAWRELAKDHPGAIVVARSNRLFCRSLKIGMMSGAQRLISDFDTEYGMDGMDLSRYPAGRVSMLMRRASVLAMALESAFSKTETMPDGVSDDNIGSAAVTAIDDAMTAMWTPALRRAVAEEFGVHYDPASNMASTVMTLQQHTRLTRELLAETMQVGAKAVREVATPEGGSRLIEVDSQFLLDGIERPSVVFSVRGVGPDGVYVPYTTSQPRAGDSSHVQGVDRALLALHRVSGPDVPALTSYMTQIAGADVSKALMNVGADSPIKLSNGDIAFLGGRGRTETHVTRFADGSYALNQNVRWWPLSGVSARDEYGEARHVPLDLAQSYAVASYTLHLRIEKDGTQKREITDPLSLRYRLYEVLDEETLDQQTGDWVPGNRGTSRQTPSSDEGFFDDIGSDRERTPIGADSIRRSSDA